MARSLQEANLTFVSDCKIVFFLLSVGLLDHRVRFINSLEVGIRSVITKLHKTLSSGGKTYIKEKYTKLYQEILCKTVKFIVFSRFSYKTLLQLKSAKF